MRSFWAVVCLFPFLAECLPAQRMASTYPNLQAFIDSCPQNDPYTPIILQDFQILKDGIPVADIACTEPYTQMPATEITDELAALQSLRFMYYMDMGRSGYLPWTSLRLYDWVKSRVAGINIDSQIAGGDCCFFLNGGTYISVGSLSAVAAASGTSIGFQAIYRQTPDGLAANVGLYAHEARHTEGNGYHHVTGCPEFPTKVYGCDETYNLANLSPYGIQYWLAAQMLSGRINLGYSCDPTTQIDLGYAFEELADVFPGRFVTNPPPKLNLPKAPGGACIPASTFTLDSAPSVAAGGSNLVLGIRSSSAKAGWTAGSESDWITPVRGMNATGSGQAVFALSKNPGSSVQPGNVVVAGATVSVDCAASSCKVSGVNTIAFEPLENVAIGIAPFTVSATASSGLPVALDSTTPAVCRLSGTTVTVARTGACSIKAKQHGNSIFSEASPVTQSFLVTGDSRQAIQFSPIREVTFGVAPFRTRVSASSGLPVALASMSGSVCTVSGDTVTVVSEGTCSILATQAGNEKYTAATPVVQSFPVIGSSQVVWRLSADFADGGVAIGYFVFDQREESFSNWEILTTGGDTDVFFPFDFTPENSGMFFDSNVPGGRGIYFTSAAVFPDSKSNGVPENLDLVAILDAPLSGAGGTMRILTGQLPDGYSSVECFDCDPSRVITRGVVTTTGPLPPAVIVTPSASSITTAQTLQVTVEVYGGSSEPVPDGTVTLKSGGYTSAPKGLAKGSAVIAIPARSLETGSDTLTVTYKPATSKIYETNSGTAMVTVTAAADSK
jgi:hypothetical protein